mmetsp:Transcript_11085/g.13756  ORF Transcript_11085/g.13756 Transcript_11085/m.13756 type:complete len:325 (+) Transcript_11085:47-1021(+)
MYLKSMSLLSIWFVKSFRIVWHPATNIPRQRSLRNTISQSYDELGSSLDLFLRKMVRIGLIMKGLWIRQARQFKKFEQLLHIPVHIKMKIFVINEQTGNVQLSFDAKSIIMPLHVLKNLAVTQDITRQGGGVRSVQYFQIVLRVLLVEPSAPLPKSVAVIRKAPRRAALFLDPLVAEMEIGHDVIKGIADQMQQLLGNVGIVRRLNNVPVFVIVKAARASFQKGIRGNDQLLTTWATIVTPQTMRLGNHVILRKRTVVVPIRSIRREGKVRHVALILSRLFLIISRRGGAAAGVRHRLDNVMRAAVGKRHGPHHFRPGPVVTGR